MRFLFLCFVYSNFTHESVRGVEVAVGGCETSFVDKIVIDCALDVLRTDHGIIIITKGGWTVGLKYCSSATNAGYRRNVAELLLATDVFLCA